MPCCKTDEFGNWCKDYPTFEYEGEEYCIFHAPAECPEKQDVEAFNEKVFERIDECKERGEECDLRGTIFPGDISFKQYGEDNPLPKINFIDAAFSGSAYFMGAVFSGYANFIKAAFSGSASFSKTAFSGDAKFRAAAFSGYADFIDAAFSGDANFSDAAFSGIANFRAAAFSGTANFIDAAFSGIANFIKAAFSGDAYFSKAAFSGSAYFSDAAFSGYADFIDAAFSGSAYFSDAAFSGSAYFSKAAFSGSANFPEASFGGTAIFDEAAFGNGYFRGAHFVKKPIFFRSTFNAGNFNQCTADDMIEFDQANLARLSLLNAPLEKLRFIDCKWPKYDGRSVIYDSRIAKFKENDQNKEAQNDKKENQPTQPSCVGQFTISNIFQPEPFSDSNPPPDPSRLADVFRRLKKIAADARDEPLASDWHYAEKEMQRRAAKKNNFWFYLGLTAYKWDSGYGEAPARAAVCLAILLLIPWLASLLPPDWGWASCLASAFSDPKLCIPQTDMEPTKALGYWHYLGLKGYQVLVLVQAGLFGFAVRNKMRR